MKSYLHNLKPVMPPDPPGPPADISNGKKLFAVFLAVGASVAATGAAYLLWGVLGIFTHVIAMCSDAPRWWGILYLCLLVTVFIPGYFAGKRTYRWYVQREKIKLGIV